MDHTTTVYNSSIPLTFQQKFNSGIEKQLYSCLIVCKCSKPIPHRSHSPQNYHLNRPSLVNEDLMGIADEREIKYCNGVCLKTCRTVDYISLCMYCTVRCYQAKGLSVKHQGLPEMCPHTVHTCTCTGLHIPGNVHLVV